MESLLSSEAPLQTQSERKQEENKGKRAQDNAALYGSKPFTKAGFSISGGDIVGGEAPIGAKRHVNQTREALPPDSSGVAMGGRGIGGQSRILGSLPIGQVIWPLEPSLINTWRYEATGVPSAGVRAGRTGSSEPSLPGLHRQMSCRRSWSRGRGLDDEAPGGGCS